MPARHLKEATLPSTTNERSWKHRFLQHCLILNHSVNLVPFINKTLGKTAVEFCVTNTKKVLWVRPQHWVIYMRIQTKSGAFNLNPHRHQVPWEANETVPGPMTCTSFSGKLHEALVLKSFNLSWRKFTAKPWLSFQKVEPDYVGESFCHVPKKGLQQKS